jgi:hypothetical protein
MYERIEAHGRQLLAIFPRATERDPVKLCKRLRQLEAKGARLAVGLSNGDIKQEDYETERDVLVGKLNTLLGNAREYQPKTGAKCGCKRGIQRDNCANCEGTGYVIDFAAIRRAPPVVPVFLNGDPRGYALKIRDEWMHKAQTLRRDGEPVYTGPDPETWIHRNHSFSVAHALEHEGYRLEPVQLHRDWGGYGILAPDLS